MITGFVSLTQKNTATRLSSEATATTQMVSFFGYGSFASGLPVNNTNTVFLGTETGRLPIKVTAGSTVTYSFGSPVPVSNFYVAGDSGDGCFFLAV